MKLSFTVVLSLILLATIKISAQDKVLNLDSSDSGAKEYIARDEINFLPGYSWNGSSSETLEAKIDRELICENEPIPFYNTPNPATRQIDKELTVGTIPGSVNVSASGGATYQIPIYTPPGKDGVQPQISIGYNSQGGNGILGMGWGLSGLSAISLVSSNYYLDGTYDGVSLGPNDQFALDGNRLILESGAHGFGTATYNTESETFSDIIILVSPLTGRYYFLVTTRDGTVMEYGYTPDSYVDVDIEGQTFSKPYMWRLSKITDVNGNYMSFVYNELNNESYIKKIEYSGNENTNLIPYNSIEFFYERRIDLNTNYLGGASIPSSVLLYSIIVKAENQVEREYKLQYTTDIYSKLVQIDELNSDNEKFNSTIFQWDEINQETSCNVISIQQDNDGDLLDRFWTSGDMDGDGISEVICIFNYSPSLGDDFLVIQMFQANEHENGIPTFSLLHEIHSVACGSQDREFYPRIIDNEHGLMCSVNGDNKPDLVIPIYFNPVNGDPRMEFYFFNYNQYDPVNDLWVYLSSSVESMPPFIFSDFNMDGNDDFLYIENARNENSVFHGEVWLIDPVTYDFSKTDFDIDGSYSPERIIPIDFNVDGLMDIMVLNENRGSIYRNNGGSFTFDQSDYSINSNQNYIEFGDFNGDGMMDLILNEDDTQDWKFAINNGNFGFSYIDLTNIDMEEENFTTYNDHQDDCIVTDFNNDGKSDVIIIDSKYIQDGNDLDFFEVQIDWLESTGSGLNLVKTLFTTDEYYARNELNILGDFNGDGRMDLINYGGQLILPIVNDDNWRIYSAFNEGFNEGLISSISNGLGQKTSIQYRPLSYDQTPEDEMFYHKNYLSTSTFPVMDIQFPLYSVWTVSNPDGVGGEMVTDYSYEGAKIHTQGRGFLGYEIVISKNQLSKSIVLSEIDETYYLPYNTSVKKYYYNNDNSNYYILSTTENDPPEFYDLTSKRYLMYSPKTTQTDNKGNINISEQEINSSGYLLSQINTVKEGTSTISSETIIYTGHNTMGQPATVSKTYSRPLDPLEDDFTESTSLTYNTNGSISTSIHNGVITEYEYDETISLPSSVTISESGIPESERETLFDYEVGKERFLIKETNPLLDYIEKEVDKLGNIILKKDINGLVTEYQYNGWGKLIKTTLPNQQKITSELTWAEGDDLDVNALYTETSSLDGVFLASDSYDEAGSS